MSNLCTTGRRAVLARGLRAAALALLCNCGCGNDAPSEKEAERIKAKRGFVAFVGAGENDPLWPVLRASAQRQEAAGGTMEVRYFAAAGGTSREQADLLEGLRDADFRGLCIHAKDPETIAPVLASVQSRGVVIVSMVHAIAGQGPVSHVGLDETAVGRELARATSEVFGSQRVTLMLIHAGHTRVGYGPRYLAFQEGLNLANHISVLGEFDCGGDGGLARRIIRERSELYPRLTAWVAIADWPSEEGVAEGTFLGPGIRYITFGGLPGQWDRVSRGMSPCLVAADYGEIGGRALQLCESAVRSPVQPGQVVHVPVMTITPANLESYKQRWRGWIAPASSPSP